ncbi:tryptophan synthase subunit alpha [Marinicrinis lubricantis]|uniref:Tryptophan synthase alpha chain n=1 Tax=Marinicrinis lubricantis TaxID=2086470 RepID=A0ABW1IM20_9BACL
MNRIDQKFAELKASGQTAYIPFISIGDPSLETSLEIIAELEKAGADMVELGVPYSDPLADGPVIQRASERALQNRVTLMDCIQVGRKARDNGVQLPFILFTYYNPVLQFGLEHFFDTIKENEISGLIIPDLPLEEDSEVRQLAEKYDIHLIPLVAPTSKERVERIASKAKGFVYCVSSLGVTGERSSFSEEIDTFIRTVKEAANVPVAVGFGISSREQFEFFSRMCDGVIIGSAIVRSIESNVELLKKAETKEQGLLQIREFVSSLKA